MTTKSLISAAWKISQCFQYVVNGVIRQLFDQWAKISLYHFASDWLAHATNLKMHFPCLDSRGIVSNRRRNCSKRFSHMIHDITLDWSHHARKYEWQPLTWWVISWYFWISHPTSLLQWDFEIRDTLSAVQSTQETQMSIG